MKHIVLACSILLMLPTNTLSMAIEKSISLEELCEKFFNKRLAISHQHNQELREYCTVVYKPTETEKVKKEKENKVSSYTPASEPEWEMVVAD